MPMGWVPAATPKYPKSPSAEPSPHVSVQRYELPFAPRGATRAVTETAVPGDVRMSTPTSTDGAGGGGGGPSLALHVAAHTATVATTANIPTRAYRMSSFRGSIQAQTAGGSSTPR